jgi:hypothetical protein
MTFYSLMVVTCLLAPMCHYDTADSFGLLVRSAEECRTVAQQIAESRAAGGGYEAEWKCSAPEVAGTWHSLGEGESSNGLWSRSEARSGAADREAYWR